MKRVWAFLSQPQNLAVFIALAGGLGFLWKEVVAPKSHPDVSASVPAVNQQASADGGTAINAAGQAQVGFDSVPSGAAPASMPRLSASQSARASGGGTAINATDSARVTIKRDGSEDK